MHNNDGVDAALARCGIPTRGLNLETFSLSEEYTLAEVQEAAQFAAAFMKDDRRSQYLPIYTPARVDVHRVGSHLIAFGNLMAQLAMEKGRPFPTSATKHWHIIIQTLYEVLKGCGYPESIDVGPPMEFHAELQLQFQQQMAEKQVDLTETGFVWRGGGAYNPPGRRDGALGMLFDFVLLVCQQSYLKNRKRLREIRKETKGAERF